jgi:hypothetical protein
LVSVHGAPRYRRSDYGPEFVATAILRWPTDAQIETAHIEPGKPWQNATDESFTGKFRDEHLSLQWSRNRVEAKVGIEQWRRALQRGAPAFEPELPDTGRVQKRSDGPRSVRAAALDV